MPEQYGPWATLHTRFRRWALDGTFERILQAAQARVDEAGDIDWLVSVDSTVVRAHQHAAGARKGAPQPRTRTLPRWADQQNSPGLRCPGASARFHPSRAGNTDDCTQFTAAMDAIRVPRPGPGRPRIRPDHVIGDKSYSSKTIRAWLRRRGVGHTIPEWSDQIRNRRRRGHRDGRPPGLRQAALQTAQRRRTLLQPLETVARDRHPPRQDRRVLPSRCHPRITPYVG
ncbi:transposase [Nonomuraea africana]|uniref:transposase n=1 Tax=Nonomuraea africana TaxID=46171 RepID=UPI003CD07C73